MKAFLLVAALGFGYSASPASACDWQKEANYSLWVVARRANDRRVDG